MSHNSYSLNVIDYSRRNIRLMMLTFVDSFGCFDSLNDGKSITFRWDDNGSELAPVVE